LIPSLRKTSSKAEVNLMKVGLLGEQTLLVVTKPYSRGGCLMLYVGLDLSRKRLDFDALLPDGERFERGAVPPDADGLLSLVRRLGDANEPVFATIESMSGARFVHDRLELAGWDVRIADAYKAKGLAPLACKTDKSAWGRGSTPER
jgi:hypothetical protein